MGSILSSSPLPLDLLRFEGFMENDFNRLEWTTDNEKNVRWFELERSNNGINDWVSIGKIQSEYTGTEQPYFFTDRKPVLKAFYRLKMVDDSETPQFSRMVALERSPSNGLVALMPNPAQSEITVQFQSATEQAFTLRIVAPDGRVVLERALDLAKGSFLIPLDISSLPAGLYFCTTGNGGGLRFLKQ